jgi:hypothetical protein
MRQSIRTIAFATVAVISLAACSHLHRQDSSAYSVTPAGSNAPTAARLAGDYGCTAQQVADNWQVARLELARPGTPICIANMQLVSMLHRQPNGRFYNATFVYYDDNKINRELNRPVGKWLVDRVTSTR